MNTANIIGRKAELSFLQRLYESDKSEFLAIYGRRRVGKSYLVEEAFRGNIAFSAVGIFKKDANERTYKQTQLIHFYSSLVEYGLNPQTHRKPKTWLEAFNMLRELLLEVKSERKVIFLDELPWLAGPQSSELIEELGYFWNHWASSQRNIFLIVCGSATSWMLDNVIRDYGGLHGRLTAKFQLQPFTLSECEQYYSKRGFYFSRYEIALGYMAIGGIPYYMDQMRSDLSLADNLNSFFFGNSSISQEFKDVYTGLFSSSEKYVEIVKALGRKTYGLGRDELSYAVKIKAGGTLSKMLENLQESGVIRTYSRYGGARKETVYQLKDFFSIFYLSFIDSSTAGKQWNSFQRSSEYMNWAGRTFELLCSQHIEQIKDVLRIKYAGKDYCWRGAAPDGQGAQIDLVLPVPSERTDYIFEMKFSENKFAITAKYEEDLRNKIVAFQNSKQHKKSHSLLLVMATTYGLTKSVHNVVRNSDITLDDLF